MGSVMRGGMEGPNRYLSRPEVRGVALSSINVPNMSQTLAYGCVSRVGDRVDLEALWHVVDTVGNVPFWLDLPYPARGGPFADLPCIIGRVGARRNGVAYVTGNVTLRSATTAQFAGDNYAVWSGTSPQAWGLNDDFWVSISYFAQPA